MFCYNCGCKLSKQDFCTACGADVSLYKKIMYISNRFYNEGLEKAEVRDLSGAIISLKQSLKFNKNNIEARNLLGLVYFELGEVVEGLTEWVISKNMQLDNNIADDYINRVQSNASRLDSMNQTVKKYNRALNYCLNESKDLALIQIKKVIAVSPRFVRARQLLALLYMDTRQWEKANKEIRKALEVDRNNTLSLRYQKIIKQMLASDESNKPTVKRKKEEAVRFQRDNEVIIQPLNVKEPKRGGISTLLNIGIGLIIGLAAMYFLVVPAAVANVNNDNQKTVAAIGNQLDAKTSRIAELETQITDLQEENNNLHQELESYIGTDGALQTVDSLLLAAKTYFETQDPMITGENLEIIAQNVKLEETSEAFQGMYQALLNTIGPELASTYYEEGSRAYNSEDFATAIENFSKAVYYDASNVNSLYNLGQAYRRNGDNTNAVATYQKVIELFPDTDRATKAQQQIEQISVSGN